MKTFKYRLQPSKANDQALQTLELCRWIYNETHPRKKRVGARRKIFSL
jgi:hypothetical protein